MAVDTSDPLAHVTAPPANETPEERGERIRVEQAAKARSDRIDEALAKSATHEKRRRKATKLLLVGQAESGKSTVLKNLQIHYSPDKFHKLRPVWSLVVLFNTCRSAVALLDAIAQAQAEQDAQAAMLLTDTHRRLIMGLSPLREVEQTIKNRLLSQAERHALSSFAGYDEANHDLIQIEWGEIPSHEDEEEMVWKAAAKGLDLDGQAETQEGPHQLLPDVHPSAWVTSQRGRTRRGNGTVVAVEDAIGVLRACQENIKSLWQDDAIRNLLKARKVRVQDIGGFFLDDIERVLDVKYLPTDEDILRARVRTRGVQEHRFELPAGFGELWVYDVGGAKYQRSAWEPFFQDVNALLFLAPISAWDQMLKEDPTINRMIDSLALFKSLCKSELLKNVSIVLFLNKCDELEQKLALGLRVEDFVQLSTKREAGSDVESVKNYFKRLFHGAFTKYGASSQNRNLYQYFTTITDVKSTRTLIGKVMDLIIKQNLEGMSAL